MKKGDTVIIIAGKEKGKKGVIAKMLRAEDKVIVEGLNLMKRHMKPKKAGEKGGIIEILAPLHVSNVKLAEAKKKEEKVAKKTVKKVTKKEEATN